MARYDGELRRRYAMLDRIAAQIERVRDSPLSDAANRGWTTTRLGEEGLR